MTVNQKQKRLKEIEEERRNYYEVEIKAISPQNVTDITEKDVLNVDEEFED